MVPAKRKQAIKPKILIHKRVDHMTYWNLSLLVYQQLESWDKIDLKISLMIRDHPMSECLYQRLLELRRINRLRSK